MYNDIYATNKHAFRDGFVVGVIATIVAAVTVNALGTKESRRRTDEFVENYKTPDQK